MKRLKIAIILMIFSVLCGADISAQEIENVEITVNSDKEVNKENIDIVIQIKANSINELINQGKASYHIYDKEGNVLVWEGERVPISYYDDETGMAKFNISLGNYISDYKDLVIKFDIVNEEKSYWVSTSPVYDLTQEGITFSYQEEIHKVQILASSDKQVYNTVIETDLEIVSDNIEILSKEGKLSYHIYDENGEVLVWEGKRIPIQMVSGKGNAKISIDLEGYLVEYKKDKLVIKFDIVNEEKSYWISTSPSFEVSTQEIVYVDNQWEKAKETVEFIVMKQPLILIVNLCGCMIMCIFIIKLRKTL